MDRQLEEYWKDNKDVQAPKEVSKEEKIPEQKK
jgi:hypothetical protein